MNDVASSNTTEYGRVNVLHNAARAGLALCAQTRCEQRGHLNQVCLRLWITASVATQQYVLCSIFRQ